MKYKSARIICWVILVSLIGSVASAQTLKDGEGISSQLLWSTPGPGNFPFVQSAEILDDKQLSFSIVADHFRKPLALEINDTVYWSVQRVTAMDFSWAIGLLDRFQLGIVLPVHVEQAGTGAAPLNLDDGATGNSEIGTTAIGDLRIHAKTLLVQQYPNAEIRGAGVALDMGLSIPIGDEKNFAGENGIIWAPSLVLDFRRNWLSAGTNIGVRLRSGEKSGLADSMVGNQMAYGLGVTIHLLEEKLLMNGETTLLAEVDDFERMGLELRGALGTKPGPSKAVTVWLTASAGLANKDEPLLCVPQMRFTLGLSYTPSKKDVEDDLLF